MAVSGKNVNQRKFFQDSACLSQARVATSEKFRVEQSSFWQRSWRHWCAVNHDATFLLWTAYQHQWRNLFHSGGGMGVCRENGTKMSRKPEVNSLIPILTELILAMPLYIPVWHSHCARASFTVLVSCSDELCTVHSCPRICLQGQVAKLGTEINFILRNYCETLGQNCSTIGLYCVAITWQPILQMFASSCGNRCFAACDCWTQASWQVMQWDSYCW